MLLSALYFSPFLDFAENFLNRLGLLLRPGYFPFLFAGVASRNEFLPSHVLLILLHWFVILFTNFLHLDC